MANSSSVVFRFVDGDGATTTTKTRKTTTFEEDLFLTYSTHVRFHCLVCPSQVFEEKLFVYLASFVDNLNYVPTVITKIFHWSFTYLLIILFIHTMGW